MKYTIEQIGPNDWQLVAADGTVVGTFSDQKDGRTGYDLAMLALAGLISQSLRAAADAGNSEDGLLPEAWVSDKGIAFSERLAGGRDFTMTKWSWRNPAMSTLPVMLQTKTDMGHFGAELAGFATEITEDNGTIHSAGRFYDTEMGVEARDYLLDGRSFGVSVDPGEGTQVDEEFECTETDDEGMCIDGTWSLNFLAYEIIGMTMTPFQGFPKAAIKLAKTVAASNNAGVTKSYVDSNALGTIIMNVTEPALQASASADIEVPVRPSREMMLLAAPVLGEPFLNGELADEFLVDQGNGQLAMPLVIEPPYVFGHLAHWGACHTGNPWGPGVCAGPEPSLSGYAYFHTGHMICDDGTDVATGVLTVGPEHAPENAAPFAAADYYASAANGWADVHVTDDEFGIFACGVLRPNLTEMDLRVLRALSISGDWRGIGGNMEMIGALAVNGPGLPIKRDLLAASAWEIGSPSLRASARNGERRLLIAAGMVTRCAECGRRRAQASAGHDAALRDARLDRVLAIVERIDRRTRHFDGDAIAAMRAELLA